MWIRGVKISETRNVCVQIYFHAQGKRQLSECKVYKGVVELYGKKSSRKIFPVAAGTYGKT